MRNVVDWTFLVSGESLVLGFLILGVLRGAVRRYLYLYVYAAGILACDGVRYLVLRGYGFKSNEYYFAYFGSDVLLQVLNYLAIISLFEIILRESPLRTQARMAFLFLIGLVAAMSYGFTSNLVISNETKFFKRLTVELQQNMYFATVVLTAMVCLTLAHLRVREPQLRAIVGGLGMFGALQAGAWALQNLVPKNLFLSWWGYTQYIPPFATCTMMAIWCYAFWALPSSVQVGDAITTPETEPATHSSFVPAFARVEARS